MILKTLPKPTHILWLLLPNTPVRKRPHLWGAPWQAGGGRGVALSVCRVGAVLELTVRVGAEDGLGTPLLVHWAGAQLQVPAHSP